MNPKTLENNRKLLQRIAKLIQRLDLEDICYDDFLDKLNENDIANTRRKLSDLLSFVSERVRDIHIEKAVR